MLVYWESFNSLYSLLKHNRETLPLGARSHRVSASTLRQLCDDASDTVLVENNGVATHFGAIHCYCPQPSCSKVMFLHLCVILFTVRRGVSVPACTTSHMTRGSLSRGILCRGGSLLGRPPRQRPPSYGNERAVHILLECILVFNENSIAKP